MVLERILECMVGLVIGFEDFAPEGSPTITSIEDSPQDQGGMVESFDGLVWDNTNISNNVTSYSFGDITMSMD